MEFHDLSRFTMTGYTLYTCWKKSLGGGSLAAFFTVSVNVSLKEYIIKVYSGEILAG